MNAVLLLIVAVPLVAVVASAVPSRRIAQSVTVGAAVLVLVLVLVLSGWVAAGGSGRQVSAAGVLRADALSMVFVLATAFLYATTAVYSIGYLAAEAQVAEQVGGEEAVAYRRYVRRFYLGVNVFAWSMLCAPLVNGLALLWVAIEITTVVSALLVAIDDTEGATEAAWKYVLIASCGLGVALLATIFMYYAGSQVLGQSYDLAFDPLSRAAHALPATPVRLSFVLAVLGFGTKVGLFPVHTWLPDAHAEAPTPVSALLSGSLLAVSFYAILRYYQVAVGRLGPQFPQRVLLVFGVASLLLAALYVLDQSDVKRLLAYSSVEHMGILAIGVSFGAPLALAGVMLHVLAHAAAKGNAFMGAGVLVRAYGTKSLTQIHGAMGRLPWSGPLFLIAVLALSALPPFGIFRSEFEIVAGGLGASRNAGAAILVVLVTMAFLGLGLASTRILFGEPAPINTGRKDVDGSSLESAEPALVGLTTVGAGGRTKHGPPAGGLAARSGVAGAGPAPAGGEVEDVVDRAAGVMVVHGEPSWWMVAPPVVGVAVLIVLGVDPPVPLVHLLQHAATLLSAGAR